MAAKDKAPVARMMLQRCVQARLQVKPAEGDSEAQFVQVRTGDRVTGGPYCLYADGLLHFSDARVMFF